MPGSSIIKLSMAYCLFHGFIVNVIIMIIDFTRLKYKARQSRLQNTHAGIFQDLVGFDSSLDRNTVHRLHNCDLECCECSCHKRLRKFDQWPQKRSHQNGSSLHVHDTHILNNNEQNQIWIHWLSFNFKWIWGGWNVENVIGVWLLWWSELVKRSTGMTKLLHSGHTILNWFSEMHLICFLIVCVDIISW